MPGPPAHPTPSGAHDPRMAVVAGAAWLGGLAAHGVGPWALCLPTGLVVGLLVGAVVRGRLPTRATAVLTGCAIACAGVVAGVLLRGAVVTHGMLPELAAERAVATVTGTVVSDPAEVGGRWGSRFVLRVRLSEVTARGSSYRLGVTVVVLGDGAWSGVELGSVVRTTGRLAPAEESEVGALVVGARAPVRIRGPDPWWRGAQEVRTSVRDAVADLPDDRRALVPALVVGDDTALSPELESDFRTTGLTHLTAVSGTNLTLVVGFLLLLGRSLGVRGRWSVVVGLVGTVGFVLLARTEPSVLRAAAMGVVGLVALGNDGRRRGLRALGVAVTCLLLVSPGLAVSAGFTLSVLATAGIVVVGPPVQEALGRWLPGPVAAAVAVPFAAQLACTPVVAALSGEVSVVAVLANVLVAPAVGPATVLGLAGGLVGLVHDGAAGLLGTAAGWCVAWIVAVATWGAGLPVPSVTWGTGSVAIGVLATACAVVAATAPRVLRSRGLGIVVGLTTVVVVLGVPGRVPALPGRWPGAWPPDDWVLVACDVGQGDALVVPVAPGAAVVVDAGPDPVAVDRCLDRLEVEVVPLVVLTHFHADHVDGLDGVLRGRRVAAVEMSPMLDPADGYEDVVATARRAGLAVAASPYGSTRRWGDTTVQVVWPDLAAPVRGPGDGSAANDASVVLLVETHGLRILLTGDVEPPAQARLAAALPGLEVDVLKVPHHGSSHQDQAWIESLDAEVALVSAGADNDYGHPDPSLLSRLTGTGTAVGRTDRDGDLAVVAGEGGPVVVTRD